MTEISIRTRRRDVTPLVAFGLAAAASLALLLAPTGEREAACFGARSSVGTPAPVVEPDCQNRVSHVSLLQEQGASVAVVLAIPVAIAGAALALQWTRWSRGGALVTGTLLAFFAVLGAASIGLFYLPSAVALFMVASRPRQGPSPT